MNMNTNAKNLTRNQSLVYDALSRSQAPLSAYVILDKLRDSGFRAPPRRVLSVVSLVSVMLFSFKLRKSSCFLPSGCT